MTATATPTAETQSTIELLALAANGKIERPNYDTNHDWFANVNGTRRIVTREIADLISAGLLCPTIDAPSHRTVVLNPAALDLLAEAETTDAEILAAWTAKTVEIAADNGWTLKHTQTVMLNYLRDTDPAAAATVAAALSDLAPNAKTEEPTVTAMNSAEYHVTEHWSSRTERMFYSVALPFHLQGAKGADTNYLTTASGARRTWRNRRAAQAVADVFNKFLARAASAAN